MDVGILQGYIQPITSWTADISHLQLTKSTNLAPAEFMSLTGLRALFKELNF